MESHSGTTISNYPSKPKKPKSRQVSSRFLSSTSPSTDHYANQTPNKISVSPHKQKPRSSTDSRKQRSLESGFFRGLWPMSSNSKPDTTLADHLGQDRLKDLQDLKHDQNAVFLNRQRSCKEFNRFENEKKTNYKEISKPVFGGSMRYTGKFKFPGKSSKSSNLSNDHSDVITPARFSVDESSLRKKSFDKGVFSDTDTQDSGTEYSDICSSGTSFDTPAAGKKYNVTSEKYGKYSPASYMAPTASSRKHGIEVSSKFMHDLSSRSRRWSADSGNNYDDNSNNSSPKTFKGNGKWALSSGRRLNSPRTVELSSSKPPTSPSRGKGVGNILSKGIELLKGKKSSSSTSLSQLGAGQGSTENVHQLRLLHSRLMQWRFCNARAVAVNRNVVKNAERNLICVWNGLINLQQSVLQKRSLLQKEKLEMKLNYILQSQSLPLENWGNMERQHISSVSTTKDYLHYAVCRIPLIDGAKVEIQSASISVRHASDLAASITWMLTNFSPTVEKTIGELTELATVVTQEKLLLEECLELFRIISALEIQERSLVCSIMQFKLLQQQILA